MSKLSIIVTVYKNEKNLFPFYDNFVETLAPELEDYEIIMVNDASPDASWDVMRQIAAKNPKVKLIKLSRNFGAVAASYTGLKYATGDCATIKAADLQEPYQLTLDMYEKWKNGAKSVIAVRESRNDSKLTNFASGIYYWLMQKFVTKDMPRGGFDTYLVDRQIIDKLIEMNEHNSPITLLILWMGFTPEKVYYKRLKRTIGKSSWTFSKKMKLFVDSFIGFSYIPIRFMSMTGFVFFIFSILWGIEICLARLIGRISIQGYTPIFVLILFSAGLIMFTLGILGEYVWRTLDSTRNRPLTIVEETVNFKEESELSDNR